MFNPGLFSQFPDGCFVNGGVSLKLNRHFVSGLRRCMQVPLKITHVW